MPDLADSGHKPRLESGSPLGRVERFGLGQLIAGAPATIPS
jgi:hypothetical protein